VVATQGHLTGLSIWHSLAVLAVGGLGRVLVPRLVRW